MSPYRVVSSPPQVAPRPPKRSRDHVLRSLAALVAALPVGQLWVTGHTSAAELGLSALVAGFLLS